MNSNDTKNILRRLFKSIDVINSDIDLMKENILKRENSSFPSDATNYIIWYDETTTALKMIIGEKKQRIDSIEETIDFILLLTQKQL